MPKISPPIKPPPSLPPLPQHTKGSHTGQLAAILKYKTPREERRSSYGQICELEPRFGGRGQNMRGIKDESGTPLDPSRPHHMSPLYPGDGWRGVRHRWPSPTWKLSNNPAEKHRSFFFSLFIIFSRATLVSTTNTLFFCSFLIETMGYIGWHLCPETQHVHWSWPPNNVMTVSSKKHCHWAFGLLVMPSIPS